VEVDVLLGEPDPGAGEERMGRLAEDEHVARGDPDQVADGRYQGGLAGAVRSEQPEERPGRDLEVEVLQGERAVVVALGEAAQLERGSGVLEHLFQASGWFSDGSAAPGSGRACARCGRPAAGPLGAVP